MENKNSLKPPLRWCFHWSLILLVQKSSCFQKPPLHKTRRFAVHGNPAPPYLPRQIAKETENNNCCVFIFVGSYILYHHFVKKNPPPRNCWLSILTKKRWSRRQTKTMFALDLQEISVHLFHPIIFWRRNSHWFHHFPPSHPIPSLKGNHRHPGNRTAPSYMALRRGKCKRWCKPRASKPSPQHWQKVTGW